MAKSGEPANRRPVLDVLQYLPCSHIIEYQKGACLYTAEQRPAGLYLVIEGQIKISRMAKTGRQALIDIYHVNELFGESALLTDAHLGEQAMALQPAKVMHWTSAEMQDLFLKRPKLAMALLQLLIQRSLEFKQRLLSFSQDRIAQRLARALLHFGERLSTPGEAVRIDLRLTHQLLSEYVGTSREIVTYYMNLFRRLGYIQYSRQEITISPALKEWLRQNVDLEAAAAEASAGGVNLGFSRPMRCDS